MSSNNSSPIPVEQKYSIVLLVKEAFSQIDEIADLLRQGHAARVSRMMLRETLAVLHDLPPELLNEYYNTLQLLADKTVPTPHRNVTSEYAEQVVSAKRKFIDKVRHSLKLKAA